MVHKQQFPETGADDSETTKDLLQAARVGHTRIPQRSGVPDVGSVRFGDLRNVSPISRAYGLDRGRPIDRYYIEKFLAFEASLITGRVLEIGDNTYTQRFGVNVIRSDVLNLHSGIEGTTLVADLANGSELESNSFDCIIATQTLNLIYDLPSAMRTLHRILKPDGVLLCTAPGISQIAYDGWNESWYWAFTVNSAARVASEVFLKNHVSVASCGNVLSAIAFLEGLADSELTVGELDAHDPAYQMIILIKARKV
ncbi:methyltransferase domain-containing protein [Mesorhizobium sp. YM1C-6-2]|nr:methyltransferase domain-containing protein [Mesorhizobium sp. YM1C-6-2]